MISSRVGTFSVTRKCFLVVTAPFTLLPYSLMAIERAGILYRENIPNSRFLIGAESDSSSEAATARE